jgi:hypothetical protein
MPIGVFSTLGGEKALNERFLYMHTCLIGQQVEVQTKNGMVFSGIFHASNTEKAQEFGMAHFMFFLLTVSLQGCSGTEESGLICMHGCTM